jgi:[ribosomal protein S18]-alanine N-acetyltransferase
MCSDDPSSSLEFQIEKMSVAQIEEIRLLEQEGMMDPWPVEDYIHLLDNQDQWLAVTAVLMPATGPTGKVIGMGLVQFTATEMELCKLVVASLYRRHSVATHLWRALLEQGKAKHCRACFLEVRPSNYGAIRFYERNGFRLISLRPKYYSNPLESALIMGCEL